MKLRMLSIAALVVYTRTHISDNTQEYVQSGTLLERDVNNRLRKEIDLPSERCWGLLIYFTVFYSLVFTAIWHILSTTRNISTWKNLEWTVIFFTTISLERWKQWYFSRSTAVS